VAQPFWAKTGEYVLNVSKVLLTGNGTFDGVILVSLGPEYFDTLLHSVLYAPDMRATLMHGGGIFDWGAVHDSWRVSPECYTMLGYASKEGTEDRNEGLAGVYPDDRAMVEAAFQAGLNGETAVASSQACEYEARIQHADGTYRWQYVKGFGVKYDPGGRPIRQRNCRSSREPFGYDMRSSRLELRPLRAEDEVSFKNAIAAFTDEIPPFEFAFDFDESIPFTELWWCFCECNK
jgi:hypothetical protein